MKTGYLLLGLGPALVCIGLGTADVGGSGRQPDPVRADQIVVPAQPPSPRDRPSAPTVGRGALRGRVVDGQSGAAIARARVRLTGRGLTRPPVLSDSQGGFLFSGLPTGVYVVNAEKSTYLPGSYPEFGRTLRTPVGQQLILQDGQTIDNVVVSMYHGGAITGRVVDATGDPIENAQVSALPTTGALGGRSSPRGTASTNDIGEFRLGRLPPGRYVLVSFANNRFQDGPALDGPPLPQPIPTYYPNVLSKGEAQPTPVGRGETVSGIEIVMAEGVPTVVTGRVVAADGHSVASGRGGGGAYLNARLEGRESMGNSTGAGLRPDGSFRLLLAPGNYVLEARQNLPPVAGAIPGRPNEQFGMTKLTVAGESVDAMIVIGGGATASGRVVFEGATPPPPPPTSTQASVPLSSPDGGNCRSGQPQIAPDWSFTIDGLMGTCAAPGYNLFGRWMLKSVDLDNRDLKSGSVTFEPGQHYDNFRIVVTDRRTEVTLHVTDDRGQPTRDYVALLFPVDRTRWEDSGFNIRSFVPRSPALEAMMRATAGQPAPAGPGSPPVAASPEMLAGLAPGEYYAIALDDIGAEASREPGVLQRLSASASRVTVSEGATDVTLLRVKFNEVIR